MLLRSFPRVRDTVGNLVTAVSFLVMSGWPLLTCAQAKLKVTLTINRIETIESHNEGTTDYSAKIFFTVRVEAPPAVEDRRISCIHRPLWPKAGDTVIIEARSLRADTFATNSVVSDGADSIEIWMGGSSTAAQVCNSTSSCIH